MDKQGQLKLFDFGYMYRFDPLREFNSNGMHDPIFDTCERFETRFFSGWLLEQNYSRKEAMQLFKNVKQQGVKMLEYKWDWLVQNYAVPEIVERVQTSMEKIQTALKSDAELEHFFTLEMFRSHVLDIEDDLDGKSCTLTKIKRVQFVLDMLQQHYDLLVEGGALFYQNAAKSKAELIQTYQEKHELVLQYQL